MKTYIIRDLETGEPTSIEAAAHNLRPVMIHFMDNIQKQKGVPYSTSRKEEKKNKHRTQKARRQEGKKLTHAIQH